MTSLIPPPPWLVGFCAIVALAILVAQLRHANDVAVGRRRLVGLWLAAAILGAVVVGGRIALRFSLVPYNVKDLASTFPTPALFILGLALLSCGALPSCLAVLLRRRPQMFVRVFLPTAFAIGSLMFFALYSVVPLESIDDIVGTPRLQLADTAERWLRFVGLFIGPLAGMTLGMIVRQPTNRPLSFRVGLLILIAAMIGSWTVVVPLAITNNIVELLRGRGNLIAALGVVGYLVVLGSTVQLGAESLVGTRRWRGALVASVLVAVLSIPVAWQLFVVATNPRLDKYGQVFSARQFLFSPNREHYMDDHWVFVAFVIAQAGLWTVLAAGAAAVLPFGPAGISSQSEVSLGRSAKET
ncbi:MAG: hypothetical protein ABL961_04910 [Vicinamibacterales bacterium]